MSGRTNGKDWVWQRVVSRSRGARSGTENVVADVSALVISKSRVGSFHEAYLYETPPPPITPATAHKGVGSVDDLSANCSNPRACLVFKYFTRNLLQYGSQHGD